MINTEKEFTLRREMIYEMYKKGATYASIGRQLNVSRQRIQQILDKYYSAGRRTKSTVPKKGLDIKTR